MMKNIKRKKETMKFLNLTKQYNIRDATMYGFKKGNFVVLSPMAQEGLSSHFILCGSFERAQKVCDQINERIKRKK